MSKPGKVLKGLCKKLGVRLTVKRGKKRVYKSIKVLKEQCKRKKKKKKAKRKKVKRKRRRKFGSLKKGDGNTFTYDSSWFKETKEERRKRRSKERKYWNYNQTFQEMRKRDEVYPYHRPRLHQVLKEWKLKKEPEMDMIIKGYHKRIIPKREEDWWNERNYQEIVNTIRDRKRRRNDPFAVQPNDTYTSFYGKRRKRKRRK